MTIYKRWDTWFDVETVQWRRSMEAFNELALFAGAGGGILGGKLLGWRTICGVEIEPYPTSVLIARQNEGFLHPFPIWDDVCTFDGKPWRGIVDVVSGGFPCQDISAMRKGDGIEGKRSGLWREFARIISEVRPEFTFVENSPMLVSRGLGTVLGDLAEMGYDAEWCVLGGSDTGLEHHRKRIWILAHAQESRTGLDKRQIRRLSRETLVEVNRNQRASESGISGILDGVACRMDRLKSVGNGQIPTVAATAWSILLKRLGEK